MALEVFQGDLYLVAGNDATGTEVWRTSDGLYWEKASSSGFGDAANRRTHWDNAATAFRGSLYVGVDNRETGCEIWEMPTYQVVLPLVMKEDG